MNRLLLTSFAMSGDVRSVRLRVIACGALARELRHLGQLPGVAVEYLPANLHNRPDRIVPTLDAAAGPADASVSLFVGYADCGTSGAIDGWCAARGAQRLAGAHCFETFAGTERFDALMDDEPGTFFLTDYLALHFDALVIEGLGIAKHPELTEAYFGNYRRVVHLAQSDDETTAVAARAAAHRLGLPLETVEVGREQLLDPIRQAANESERPHAAADGERAEAATDDEPTQAAAAEDNPAQATAGDTRPRRRSRSGGPQLVTIYWRDIPLQVNAQSGRTKVQGALHRRFQRATDRAAMAAGLTKADEYVTQMRRTEQPCAPDLDAAVAIEVARIEADYVRERLNALADRGGYEA